MGHELVARGVDLERVDTLAHHLPRRLAELVGAVAHDGKGRTLHVPQVDVTQPARHRQLGRGGQRARAGVVTGVDGVAHHDVQSRFGRRGTDASGEALVEHAPSILQRAQQVLFNWHGAKAFQIGGVEKTEVRVRLDQAGHQRRTAAVDVARPRR
jgi:hypothetical protein